MEVPFVPFGWASTRACVFVNPPAKRSIVDLWKYGLSQIGRITDLFACFFDTRIHTQGTRMMPQEFSHAICRGSLYFLLWWF